MKKRNFLHLVSLSAALVALVCGFDSGRALAATIPTCNSFNGAGAPIYSTLGFPNTTGSTLCTDYFGVGNYANSPLPAGPVDISPTGFTLEDGGSGYSNPVVTITDTFNMPGIVPAVCSATLTGGSITGITCSSAGSGYMAPTVTITDATGSGAWVLAKLSAAGPFVGGIRKFVDALPNLEGALATPDVTSFPGSDYYEIALIQTQSKMHSDLSPTALRSYVQVQPGSASSCSATQYPFNYLGPLILAQKNRPTRVKFTNCLPAGAGGDLIIPADLTYMGAGAGPTTPPGTDCSNPANTASCYQQNRATLHLHGGNTPWISDGTAHQWTVPFGDTAAMYQKGDSSQSVPDMFYLNGLVVPQCSATVTTNCSGGLPAQLPAGAVNDPGQGAMTFYWTNQQSGRLMFYHDHAFGVTRLNAYAGEAAGLLLTDPVEEAALLALNVPGTIVTDPAAVTVANPHGILSADLGHLVALVIQDKGFVPNLAQLKAQDPTWIWGSGAPQAANGNGNGDFWFPHVYTTNQNPSDPLGANAFGRWDYGAWFYPAQTSLTAAGPGPLGPNGAVTIPCTSSAFPGQLLGPTDADNYLAGCPITPNPSGTPEGYMDTPLVNGKAYPVLHVAPEAYRFRILSAGNDRSWNLQLYVADATGKDVTMIDTVPQHATGAPVTPLPLCKAVNTITLPALGTGLPASFMDATGNPLNGTGLMANCWPNYGAPSPGISSKQFMWPADGREGGVPDPRTAGPAIVQIGTEGGLLPAPVVIPSTPVNYEVNTRSVTITNVSTHGLWLGTAERADAVIDFSKFSGQTLIMYNDAPTPAPAFDMRDDYYTGDQDQSTTGGAPTTVPGYGPNTRTIMQIIVDAPATGQPAFNVAKLINGDPTTTPPTPGLSGIFKTTLPELVVPQATYSVASGGNVGKLTYAKVQDTSITFQPPGLPVASITLTSGGSNYPANTTVTIAPPANCSAPRICTTATATPTVVGGVVTAITLTNVGAGYTTVPAVTVTGLPGTGAVATAGLVTKIIFNGKAIQELFTLDYGRMNATLGNELPLTNFLVQTTLPFGYNEWATEIIQDNTNQIWYLTHNGVDTHFIHFHLFNVQVINRVGWDGSVRPPEQNELGWKDTVRMNPLENIIFAVKPITPVVPFPLPDSIRLMDVTVPNGATSPAMSGVNPVTGLTVNGWTTNAFVNFGSEYVWHCHILGHEENDMMRPIIYQVAPAAPSLLTASTVPTSVTLSWQDNSASESGFILQRAATAAFLSPVSFPVNASDPRVLNPVTGKYTVNTSGGTLTYTDATAVMGQTYFYRMQAIDDFSPQSPLTAPFQTVALTSGWSNAVQITALPNPPTGVTAIALSPTSVLVSWTPLGGTGHQYRLQRSPGGANTFTTIATVANGISSYTDTGLVPGTAYDYRIITIFGGLNSAPSAIASVTTPPNPATSLTVTGATSTTVSLSWTAPAVGVVTGYAIQQRLSGAGPFVTVGTVTAPVTTFTDSGLTPLTAYDYQVLAVSGPASSVPSNIVTVTTAPDAPTLLRVTSVSANSVNLAWNQPNGNITGYSVLRSSTGVAGSFAVIATMNANNQNYQDTTVSAGATYYYQVTASSGVYSSTPSNIVSATTPATPPTNLRVTGTTTMTSVNLAWNQPNNSVTGYSVLRSSTGVAGSFAVIGTVPVGNQNYTDATLAPGTVYYYQVTATYGLVSSLPSNTLTVTTPIAASTTLRVTGTTTTTSVNLAWTQPNANATGYSVLRSSTGVAGSFAVIATVAAPTLTYTDATLAPGTVYYYQVIVSYGAYNSLPSNTVTVTTPIAAPTLLTVTGATVSSVSLSWTAPAGALTTYALQRRLSGVGAFVTVATITAPATTYTDTTVASGTAYNYQLLALVGALSSPASNSATGTTPTAAPTTLAVTGKTATTVSLSWVAPTGLITSYTLTRTGGATTTFTIGAASTAYTDTTAAANTAYTYQLVANNAGGSSAGSNIVSVTTTALPPLAPTNLKATAITGGIVTLTWTASTGATGYYIYRSTTNTPPTVGTTVPTRTVAGLNSTFTGQGAAGTTVYFWVAAYNGLGNSPAAAVIAVTK